MAYKPPCPFCEIVQGRMYAKVISAGHMTLTIEPLNPVVPGHVIVIPRVHVEDFTSNPDITAEVMFEAAHVASIMSGEGSFNLITSKGRAATQSVYHLHVHLVPRHEGDGLPLPWTPQQEAARERSD